MPINKVRPSNTRYPPRPLPRPTLPLRGRVKMCRTDAVRERIQNLPCEHDRYSLAAYRAGAGEPYNSSTSSFRNEKAQLEISSNPESPGTLILTVRAPGDGFGQASHEPRQVPQSSTAFGQRIFVHRQHTELMHLRISRAAVCIATLGKQLPPTACVILVGPLLEHIRPDRHGQRVRSCSSSGETS